MYKKSFFFIVFEGVEGTGKSFQINKLFKNLKKLNIKVEKSREPGGSKAAEKKRNLIFNKKSDKFDKLTDFYLMLAARNEHIKKKINKLKKKKTVLLCDRFTDSTHCYQVVGNGIDSKINKINNDYIIGKIKPNLTIVLKSNLNIISRRVKQRKNNNKFDNLKKNFYNSVQNEFIKLASLKKNYVIYDSSHNDNELEKKILKTVKKRLKIK